MLRFFGGEQNLRYNMFVLLIFGSLNQYEIFINNENIVLQYIVDESVVMFGVIYGEIGIEIGNFFNCGIFGGLFERFKIEVECFLFILKFEREYIFLYIVL